MPQGIIFIENKYMTLKRKGDKLLYISFSKECSKDNYDFMVADECVMQVALPKVFTGFSIFVEQNECILDSLLIIMKSMSFVLNNNLYFYYNTMRKDRYYYLNGKRKKIYYALGIIEMLIILILTIAIIPVAIIWNGISMIKEIPSRIKDSLGIRRNEWFITKWYRSYCRKNEK